MELQFHVISVWKVSIIDMHRLSSGAELAVHVNNKEAERDHGAGARTHDSSGARPGAAAEVCYCDAESPVFIHLS